MKILITGASGFIGRHVAKAALYRGHELTLLSTAKAGGDAVLTKSSYTIQKRLGDLTRSDFIGIDALIHLAAVGVNHDQQDWFDCFQTNVSDSLRCWLAAADSGVRRFIVCGSCFEYGLIGEKFECIPVSASLHPVGPYHSSKAAATMAILGLAVERKLKVSVIRPFHVYGEGEPAYRFWPSLRKAALAGSDFEMTNGEQIRDFIEVDKLAVKVIKILEETEPISGQPKIHNIGSGNPMSLKDFAEHWWQRWNASGRIIYGAVPYRNNEVMRYVPCVEEW